MSADAGRDKAIKIAESYGMIDGAHHKQWVIDQMIRALLGDGYDAWLAKENAEREAGDHFLWDHGVAP
jgi:hypothetical protein